MNYQVPHDIDENKIFLVNRSEIVKRLDAHYNKPIYSELWRSLSNKSFNLTNLKNNSSSIFSGITPKSGGNAYVQSNGIYFLRSGNFSESNEIDFSKLLQLRKDIHYTTMRGSQLKKGDLLIAIVGATIGKIGVYKYDIEANINQAICAVRLKRELNPYYVQAFYQTQIGQSIIERIKRPVARANINLEEVGGLPIPLLDKQQQTIIVNIMDDGYASLKMKEEAAREMIESIDDYLLDELCVELPRMDLQKFKDRVFTVSFSEICNGRFDPKPYSSSVKQLKQSLQISPFDKQPLKSFIKNSCSGEWGKDEAEEVDERKYTKCLVIRATEFDNTYNLQLDNSRVRYRWIETPKLSKMNIQTNDLLIEKSGGSEDQPVGRISILTDDLLKNNQIAYSNFIHKITVEGINPMYLYFYLKTMHNIGITDSMQSQTNGIRNLIMSEYFNQTIVVPPLQKQQEIVDHISDIWKQAKALQKEGKEILEQAKQKVEAIILGKNVE